MTVSPPNSATAGGIRLPGGRLRLRALAPALILLGICVFAWGLRYKLSFYAQPHSITHRMVEAKLLLTDRSVTPAAVLRNAADHDAPVAIAFWIPALLLLAGWTIPVLRDWAPEPDRVHRSQRWLFSSSGFTRPPPHS